MNKIQAGTPDTQSTDVGAENLGLLRWLFPQAIADGRVDLDALQRLLGSTVDDGDEKYGLHWHGKSAACRLALTPSTGTLRPAPEQSVNWKETKNLFIEGDNLEVLKLLQKSYSGRVRLIFIDPPYNTGKDFVYPDDYRDNVQNYLKLTGQIDHENRRISSNPEASGRFHTTWLNMMYPRLMLARNLLNTSGVILIAIDDTEIHHLRAICDEIFGDENFCGTFVWEKKKKPSFLDRNMGTVTDYIVAYARRRDLAPPFVAGVVEQGKKYPFNNAGNPVSVLTFPPGSVTFRCGDRHVSAQDMSSGNIKTELLDDVRITGARNLNSFRLRGEWRYSQAKLDQFVADNADITISQIPFRPNYVNRSGETKKTTNMLSHRINGVPTNEDATAEMRSLFGADVMSYPKPVGLLKYLIRATSSDNDIIMDFFAGSGTTGAAVLRQSIEDGYERRYVLVQLPEPLTAANKEQEAAAKLCDELHVPRTISELTKEFLRRTHSAITKEASMFSGDTGFRVFRLDSTNLNEWSNSLPEDLDRAVRLSIDKIKRDRSNADLLFELMLKTGVDLCSPIEQRQVAGKDVYAVGDGVLLACLVDSIAPADVDLLGHGIAEWFKALPVSETTCVFRDDAFRNDIAKVNLTAILNQLGIANVKSL